MGTEGKETRSYDFTCLQCEFTVTLEAKNWDDAVSEAFKRHDAYHDGAKYHCGAEHYKLVCPNGKTLTF